MVNVGFMSEALVDHITGCVVPHLARRPWVGHVYWIIFFKCTFHYFCSMYLHGFKTVLISFLSLFDRKLCLEERELQLVGIRPTTTARHVLPWKPARLSKTAATGGRISCLQHMCRVHCGDKDRAEHADLLTTQLSFSQNTQISPESNEEAAHSNDLDFPLNKFIFIVAR